MVVSIGSQRIRAAAAALVAAALCGLAGAGCGTADTSGSDQTAGTVGQPAGGLPATGTSGSGVPGATQGLPGTTSPTATGAAGATMPCAVETVVKTRCQTCHGATPIAGAPMSLLTLADFQRDYMVRTTKPLLNQTMKLYELARIRINHEMGTPAMPQGSALSAPDFTTLNTWLSSAAPAGAACVAGAGGSGNTMIGGTGSGATTGGGAGAAMGGTGGTDGSTDPNAPSNQCETDPTAVAPLVAEPGETCYDFPTHGVSGTTDTSKFTVQPGESYDQYYYAVPWPPNSVATRFGARFDNVAILHHWLGFIEASPAQPAGTVQPNVTGTTLGESAELIGGWAIGGCNVELPPDVGIKLPDSGEVMIQWHHFNSTGTAQQDGTAVQWCVTDASNRAHIGGITFLGTEDLGGPIGMPAGQMSSYSGSCTNSSGGPITIVGFSPHMHTIGVHMTSIVQRSGGGMETVFDQPFIFDSQVNYMLHPPYVLQPGDTITSTCTYNNTTSGSVPFGQSTTQEMCYQFTIAYPYGALNNGVLSLIGATNTCW